MIIESIKKYQWKGKKALIVEDDPSAAFLLSEILQYTSMQVETVNSGIDAVEKCKTDPDIDVVLLDLQIPGISGFEAATRIKKIRAGPSHHCPVCLRTSLRRKNGPSRQDAMHIYQNPSMHLICCRLLIIS